MLRQRVITAVVLVPLVLAAIVFAPAPWFAGIIGIVVAMLALEFAALCSLDAPGRALFAAFALALYAIAVMPWEYAPATGRGLLVLAVVLWLLAPVWLATRARLPVAVKGLLGLPLLAGAGFALLALKMNDAGGRWVFAAFLVVWAADIGAYAAGRTFGRHKLAPMISPGKTWEGFVGGIALVLAAGVAVALLLLDLRSWMAWALLLAILVALTVFSVIGDLLESLLKRQAGVKDSGTLLPGHGGLLDRLDSLLAVAPVFLFTGSKIGIFRELSAYSL